MSREVPRVAKESSDWFDVFICYNSQDKSAVKRIEKELQARGLRAWLDERELRPGLPWQKALEEQISTIGAAAVFVGANGLGPWQDMEIEALLRQLVKRKCPVIPVILHEAAQEPPLPLFLQGNIWVDFRRPEPDPMDQLVFGITGKRPAPGPSGDPGVGTGARAGPNEGGLPLIGGVLECGPLLGKGGMGEVYRARHRVRKTDVAVKFPRPELLRDKDAKRRFHREATLALLLIHPNIVRVHDLGEDPNRGLYIQMELVEGTTLRALLKEGPVPLDRALSIGCAVLEALVHAHEKGILHLDVKPENVLIARDGTVKLVDFGLARALGTETFGLSVQQLGTAYYVAPEVFKKESLVDARADVFSVGVILYEMLTGSPPMGNCEPLPMGVPEHVREAILDAMRGRRDRRPASAGALLARLGGWDHASRVVSASVVSASAAFGTPSLRDRLRYLEGLARLDGGDPRLHEERWVPIVAGDVTIDGLKLKVASFELAWAPVTVHEYRAFVEAADRLEDWWWGSTPREQRKTVLDCLPEFWRGQLQHLNRPVVYVSWWEATAYCRWRTARRRDGSVVRLPTEAEWQWAAEGPERRRYPWGEEEPGAGDEARANWEPARIGTPTPVGAFPGGNCGQVVDMAGNVWEWCDPASGLALDVAGLRGESWACAEAGLLRCASRGWAPRGNRDIYDGMRVVRSAVTV